MKRVTGIGGIFFKAKSPEKLHKWYQKHLGIPLEFPHGGTFHWREKGATGKDAMTVWNLFPKETRYFAPSKSPFMVNYRVSDLKKLVQALRKEGVKVAKVQDSEYGRFAWISDPEGNRIELWEPPKARRTKKS